MKYAEKLIDAGIAETRATGLATAIENLNKELCRLDLQGLRAFTGKVGILGQLDSFAQATGNRNVAKEIYQLNLNDAWQRMDIEELESTKLKMMSLGTGVMEFAELGLPGAKTLMMSMGTLIRRILGKTGLSYYGLVERANIWRMERGPNVVVESLSLRITDKYVGTCGHLDTWDRIGNFTRLFTAERGEITYDGGASLDFIHVNSRHSDEEIRKALKDSLSSQGCHHEYDCCGCVSQYVTRIKKLGANFWVVKRSWHRNI